MRKELLTICAMFLFAVFASPSVSAQSLVGTEWEDEISTYQFKAEGGVVVFLHDERDNQKYHKRGTWRQEGDKVFIEVFSKNDTRSYTIRAVIKGDKMEGTLRYDIHTTDEEWLAVKVK